jgi:hypothetical protein
MKVPEVSSFGLLLYLNKTFPQMHRCSRLLRGWIASPEMEFATPHVSQFLKRANIRIPQKRAK